MKIKKEVEFNHIVSDILENDKFINLKYERHHGISRLDHSLHVARMTYFCCKKLHVKNIEEVTRASLLHDFFLNQEIKEKALYNHPYQALINAKAEFKIDKMQENIIESHMYPLSITRPNCKESYLVSLVDKMVALYELVKYKAPIQMGAALIFIFNFLAIPR